MSYNLLQTRLIPVLLLSNGRLVKTKKYKNPRYIGDPSNTVRIFNELEADEIIILDISATSSGRGPDFNRLKDIADEAFMPLAYGGGITSFSDAQRIFNIGFEKVVLNSAALQNPILISEIAGVYGSQAVMVSMDVRQVRFLGVRVMDKRGRVRSKMCPSEWGIEAVKHGAGELLITSVDREGMWSGLDIATISSVTQAVEVPVIAHGGIGNLDHVIEGLEQGGAHSIAIGSAVVFQKQGHGVLVNFRLKDEFFERNSS